MQTLLWTQAHMRTCRAGWTLVLWYASIDSHDISNAIAWKFGAARFATVHKDAFAHVCVDPEGISVAWLGNCLCNTHTLMWELDAGLPLLRFLKWSVCVLQSHQMRYGTSLGGLGHIWNVTGKAKYDTWSRVEAGLPDRHESTSQISGQTKALRKAPWAEKAKAAAVLSSQPHLTHLEQHLQSNCFSAGRLNAYLF